MTGCLLGRLRDHRHFESPADGGSDVPHRHALFTHCMVAGSRRTLFDRQNVETRSIDPMHRRPAVEPVADKRRDALLAGDGD